VKKAARNSVAFLLLSSAVVELAKDSLEEAKAAFKRRYQEVNGRQ
jgi:hypothetical protein